MRLKLNIVRLRRQSTSAAKKECAAIERVACDLEELNRYTEQDFLAVGAKLMEFHSAARRISADTGVLSDLVSGERGGSASQALHRILELSGALHARLEDSGQALGTVRGLAARLRRAFSDLPNTVSTFRTLCTLTRIETSRLGHASTGFGDLAEEVKPLSESIQSSGETVLESASRLDRGVQAAIGNASGLRASQLHELPALIAAVTDSMQSFAERQQRAHEASAQQATQYEALCAAVNDLVRSIQFHDITRQQIEHVVEALRQLPSGGAARSVLAVQCSQLQSAAQVFASAVGGIERDLAGVAARLQGMAESSRSLMGGSEREHDSFFLRMEGCFTAILQAVAACAQAQAEMQTTAGEVDQLVARMRESIAEIRGMEIRIQRIAINATIRAEHIGTGGAPLGVIADVMQRMVSASSGNTEQAAGALDEIGHAAQGLAGGGDIQSDAGEASRQMRQAVLEMHSASEVGFSRVNQIADLGAQLAADIGALREGFSGGARFAEVVERARETLQGIAAETPVDDGAQDLAELAENYTMQAERDIHQQVLYGGPSETTCEAALGDNVEMF
ncbi:hypothetical protein SBA3_3530005 [Candidatus Sulfopaludibacter sp. SbA3]|nr:hypothetical protein SBA3_3530005 [Candidatus Sulfopaludibacter sp. SbA3]